MAERFDYYRKQVISLGLTSPAEIRDYIRQEQSIETENLLKENELKKKTQKLRKKQEKKIQSELILAEKRLEMS